MGDYHILLQPVPLQSYPRLLPTKITEIQLSAFHNFAFLVP